MAVVLTFVARVRDWKRLQAIHREKLFDRAQAVGARRYQIYRNTADASEVLLVAELPNQDAAGEIGQVVWEELAGLLEGRPPDEKFWEACGWEMPGPIR
jgi:hypothetical protein